MGKFLDRRLFIGVVIVPFIIAATNVVLGHFQFWYDPARDMLLALSNLSKVTLVGPTSGVPGIFYGPYWIWLLSISEAISKDPKMAVFLLGTLPYFLVFPLILYKFKKLFSVLILSSFFLLFMFDKGMTYATTIWNPNLSPLAFLLIIYLLIIDWENKNKLLKLFISGLAAGYIVNTNLSFGIPFAPAIVIFIFLREMTNKFPNKIELIKKTIYHEGVFLAGVAFTLVPFFVFQLRHGFSQVKTIFATLTAYGNVIGFHGMSKQEIVMTFASNFSEVLHLPLVLGLIIIGSLAVWLYKKQTKLVTEEKSLILLLITVSGSILFVFLTAKNPVWGYHFTATEIIALFAIAIIANKNKLLSWMLFALSLFLLLLAIYKFLPSVKQNQIDKSQLSEEINIVKLIVSDAGSKDYSVYAYSKSIYSYEYSYLFKWLANRDFSYDPSQIPTGKETVYLIIPSIEKNVKEDFINYRTHNVEYNTVKVWDLSDGSQILKRVKR